MPPLKLQLHTTTKNLPQLIFCETTIIKLQKTMVVLLHHLSLILGQDCPYYKGIQMGLNEKTAGINLSRTLTPFTQTSIHFLQSSSCVSHVYDNIGYKDGYDWRMYLRSQLYIYIYIETWLPWLDHILKLKLATLISIGSMAPESNMFAK